MFIDREKEPDKLVEEAKVEQAKSGYPTCPHCHMEIQADASRCPHCQHDLT
jgi:uncharacterized paraquat-inducible protein A